jgi:RNA polymerase sigma-70 factor, ECF subfamily
VGAVALGPAARSALELVERARGGDRQAFASLVETRFVRAFRTASAMLGSEADADDVVQDAFLKAWQHLPSLRNTSRFDAWFNSLLRNRCRDLIRQRRRSHEIALTIEDAVAPDDIGSVVESTGLSAAFDQLSAADRQLLVMHHLHQQPVSELALQLGIPLGTAKWRLFAARRALVRALEARS